MKFLETLTKSRVSGSNLNSGIANFRFILVHHAWSNDSQSNNALFMNKLSKHAYFKSR